LGLRRDIGTAWRRGPRAWRDLAIAVWELARANVAMRHVPAGQLPLLDHAASHETEARLSAGERALVERVAYAVPIMGLRVPWRSDCLVQAMAARRWLARGGVASDLCIGVRKDEAGFQGHAWLKVGERIVTGGDVSTYAELPPAAVRDGTLTP